MVVPETLQLRCSLYGIYPPWAEISVRARAEILYWLYVHFQLGPRSFSPVLFRFYIAGKFLAASRKSIQCLSFMFEQCSILMMLIFQLNAIIIMYELFGRKKRFAVSRCICLEKNGFKGKSSSEGVIYLGSPDRSG